MSIADDVLNNLKDVLSGLVDTNAVKLFDKRVGIYDDIDSYLDVADGMTAKTAGIIVPAAPTRGEPMSNDEEYSEFISGDIVYSLQFKRPPGGDERPALAAVQAVARIIRLGLLSDKSRGGKCGLVNANGRIVNGTSVDGDATLLGLVSNQAIYTASLPFVVGWWVSR